MKKFLFSICALFVASSTFAANTYSIDKVYLTPTGQANVAVNFSLDEDFACGGYGFTIQLPDELEFVDATVTAGDCYAAPPTITSNILASGALKVGYSSATVLTKQSGCLLICKIQAKSSVSADDVFTANLVDAMFVKAPSTSVAVADASFDIEISDKVILDETSTVAPAAQSGVNVLVKRTLKKDVWNTVCLPFAIKTKAAAEAIFGEGCEILNYTGYAATIDEETLIPSAISMKFASLSPSALKPMKAGSPYLVKPTKAITEFEASSVDVVSSVTDVIGKEVTYELDGKYTGSLVKTVVPNNGIFVSGGKFYYSTGKTNIKGFRGWFELAAILNQAVVVGAPIYMDIDGNTTKIDIINDMSNDGEYYDLNGMKILNPTKKGVYIKNGKKVVIK